MNRKINYWVAPQLEFKNPEDYVARICNEFGITRSEILGSSRLRNIADARAILSYLLHKRLKMTSLAVGKYLGRNHATVLHACKKVENLMQFEKGYSELVNKFI